MLGSEARASILTNGRRTSLLLRCWNRYQDDIINFSGSTGSLYNSYTTFIVDTHLMVTCVTHRAIRHFKKADTDVSVSYWDTGMSKPDSYREKEFKGYVIKKRVFLRLRTSWFVILRHQRIVFDNICFLGWVATCLSFKQVLGQLLSFTVLFLIV